MIQEMKFTPQEDNMVAMARQLREIRKNQPLVTLAEARTQAAKFKKAAMKSNNGRIRDNALGRHLDCIATTGCKASTETQS